MLPQLCDWQQSIAEAPYDDNATVWLEGPAGAGKTTAGVARTLRLLRNRVPAGQIMIVVPQRTLGQPYLDAVRDSDATGDVLLNVATLGGLARRNVELFWPLIADKSGFQQPTRPPTFLTLETAQYYMARIVEPAIEVGRFEGVTIQRNRLVSQLIDNLNKAAVVGFPLEDIGDRLSRAWSGDSSQTRIYDESQACAISFRRYCLDHNLLDFSLQMEVFVRHLLPLRAFREYLFGRYRHVIVDNVEEDTPVAHDILRLWLADCRSATVIYDVEAGYRGFLGADPESAAALGSACKTAVIVDDSRVMSANLDSLRSRLSRILGGEPGEGSPRESKAGQPRQAFESISAQFQPQVLDQVAAETARLVQSESMPPADIVILAPFLSDALRFTLAHSLQRLGIRVRSHRPSRALREEPATHCLLTLAMLAHPHWGFATTEGEVVQALMQSIEDLDLVRAQLLARMLWQRPGQSSERSERRLLPFEQLRPDAQDRLTYSIGERYEHLRGWLDSYRDRAAWEEPDHFISLIFGEVLSQPNFGFHRNLDAAAQAANLIESIRKFRLAVPPENLPAGRTIGQEYVDMVRAGVVAAQYVRGRDVADDDAVLLAPAYTFLTYNRPVRYQFWINAGSSGWWERIYQPVTHPYVLSRHWPLGQVWTDADELAARRTALCRLTVGLVRRCRVRVYLCYSTLSEQGYEESGPLLQAFNRLIRQEVLSAPASTEAGDV